MSTCNQLDLQTLGSQPVISKNLPDHSLQGIHSEVTAKLHGNLRCSVHNHSFITALFCSDREPVPGDSDFGLS